MQELIKELEKTYGQILIPGNSVLERQRDTIPFSPALDLILSGGIVSGSWITVSGPPKTTKTSSVLHFCSHAQTTGRKVFWFDIENRLKPYHFLGIPGLRPDEITVISSTEDKILSAQDFLTIATKLMLQQKQCVFVFDSYAVLCHEKELTDGIGTQTRGGSAVLLSQFFRMNASVVPVKDHIVIGMLHMMANTSGYGASVIEKGGNAVVYQADVRLQIKKAVPWRLSDKEDKKELPIGLKVEWFCATNSLGNPHQETTSYFRFGTGIDELTELIGLCGDFGIVKKSGKWYMTDDDDTKYDGKERFREHLINCPEIINNLRCKLREFYR